jgi:hypothetical protein
MESRQAPAPIELLVELRDVVKIHRDGAVRALDGVSLEIPAGQPSSIVGPGAQAYATTSPIWATDLGRGREESIRPQRPEERRRP